MQSYTVRTVYVHRRETMITIKTGKTKQARFNIRTTAEGKALIARAAKKENKNISDFVLENAISAAEAVLADDANFTLDKKRWANFCKTLDAPPRELHALRKLLTKPGVFDGK
jgi:uncharacterized protein (DUF1778 family)